MTEAILTHGTFKVCFRSSQNTKWPFSRIRNSWYDAENDENFPKIRAGSFAKINWMRRYNNFGIHLSWIIQEIYFCIFYHLKTIHEFWKYFEWTLRVKFRKFISLTLHFIIKWQRLKICFKAAENMQLYPKGGKAEITLGIIELLWNITEHYFLFEHLSFYK